LVEGMGAGRGVFDPRLAVAGKRIGTAGLGRRGTNHLAGRCKTRLSAYSAGRHGRGTSLFKSRKRPRRQNGDCQLSSDLGNFSATHFVYRPAEKRARTRPALFQWKPPAICPGQWKLPATRKKKIVGVYAGTWTISRLRHRNWIRVSDFPKRVSSGKRRIANTQTIVDFRRRLRSTDHLVKGGEEDWFRFPATKGGCPLE